ncbi:MAG: formylglycine-generating enzyme family protein [Verrucomicrobiae bacterium]|nr:formylglycine-generating enzyme family protein [Verrucomicrobiae bacterium]
MKRHLLIVGVPFALVLIAAWELAGLPGHAQTKPDAAALKAEPIIARLEAAVAAKDKFAAEDILTELEALIPNDARMAGWRQRVGGLPGPKRHLEVDLGGGVTMQFVAIRPGSFMMGSERSADWKPVHEVTFAKPFYMGKYEVTQEQWERIMGSNPSNFKGPKNPVEQVNWDDCQSFISKLKEKLPGRAFRLPTEAEWEYACRAGSTNDFCFGNDVGRLRDYAWYIANSDNTTHPVGEKQPNAWGLYDMHGNVWEWCQDIYRDNYMGAPADGSAWEQAQGSVTNRVLRGGSWYSEPSALRSPNRGRAPPAYPGICYGLRLVLGIP